MNRTDFENQRFVYNFYSIQFSIGRVLLIASLLKKKMSTRSKVRGFHGYAKTVEWTPHLERQQEPSKDVDGDCFLALGLGLLEAVGKVGDELALVLGRAVREDVAKEDDGGVDHADAERQRARRVVAVGQGQVEAGGVVLDRTRPRRAVWLKLETRKIYWIDFNSP